MYVQDLQFLERRKECEPWTDIAFKSPAWFCPYCSMLFCDTQTYTNGDDATTVVVVFCRRSHLGCTDMSLQQNRDKMPNFASLINYTYQINYTLNECVKYMFCIMYCCDDELVMLKSK